jgi:hypothetical protein
VTRFISLLAGSNLPSHVAANKLETGIKNPYPTPGDLIGKQVALIYLRVRLALNSKIKNNIVIPMN